MQLIDYTMAFTQAAKPHYRPEQEQSGQVMLFPERQFQVLHQILGSIQPLLSLLQSKLGHKAALKRATPALED